MPLVMEPLMHVAEALVRDVCVDLGGGDVLVPKELLHTPEVSPVGEETGGVGVAERVRRYPLREPGQARAAGDHELDRARR